jgi:hypothetical protein
MVSACVPARVTSLAPEASSEAPFVTKRFVPTVSLVPGPGWRAILDAVGSFTLDDGDPPGLRFVRVSAVFDPVSQMVTEPPQDLASWILDNPLLRVEPPRQVTIAGIQGTQIDAEVVKAPKAPYEMRGRQCPLPGCVGLLVAGVIIDGQAGSRFRFILTEVGGRPLMIEMDALGSESPTFFRRAEAVLATVRFPPSGAGS